MYLKKNLKFQNWLNVLVGEKRRIFSCLNETFKRRNILTTKHNPDEIFTGKVYRALVNTV